MKNIFWVLPAVLVLAAGCSANPTANNVNPGSASQVTPADRNLNLTPSTTPPASPSAPMVTTGNKLADQPYASQAYLISGDTLSASAQQALSGFTLSKSKLADGTLQIELKAVNPEYQSQQYLLKPGEQLYFIEKFGADDQGGQDANTHDDQAVVVNAQGEIVSGPGPVTQ